ncbi:hypothetical protein [Novacetimonas maltaceti]|nr:hypothetical protein [Novacetimonas maltaceti]
MKLLYFLLLALMLPPHLSSAQTVGSAEMHVPDNAALHALPASAQHVVRDHFANAGDAPPLAYTASNSPCSLNNGAGDGGAQVPSRDGRCWIAQFGTMGADIREWGIVMDGVTSADVALNHAAAWARANHSGLLVPGGKIAITGAQTVALDRMSLTCTAGSVDANANGDSYGAQGSTFFITSTTVQPFTLQNGVRIRDCNFYWPNQNGLNATPIAYPPLFTEPRGQQMVNVDLLNLRVVNAYDFLSNTLVDDVLGNIHLTNTYGYAVRYWFDLANIPEVITVSGSNIDINLFQFAGLYNHKNLGKWTGEHGAFLHVSGNGNGSTRHSKTEVLGLLVSDSLVFGYRYGVLVEGTGVFSESDLNLIWDAVPTVLKMNDGACVVSDRITGKYYSYKFLGDRSDHYPVFDLGAPSSDCAGNVDISGQLEQVQGDFVNVTGKNWNEIAVTNVTGPGYYGLSSTNLPYYWLKTEDTPNLRLTLIGNTLQTVHMDANHRGIFVPSALTTTLVGNTFSNLYNPIDVSGNSGAITVTGNVSTNSSSPFSMTGNYGTNIVATANRFDKVNPDIDGLLRLDGTTLHTRAPEIGSCSGLGSGQCTLREGSTSFSGMIALQPAEAAKSTGTVTLTFPHPAAHFWACTANPENSAPQSGWTDANLTISAIDTTHAGFNWSNRSRLANTQRYMIVYTCIAN